MGNDDITVQILRDIRDAVRETNARIDQVRTELSERIDVTNARIDVTNERLGKVEGALLELATQQRFMVKQFARFNERDEKLAGEVDELKRRVDDIEGRLPPRS